MIDSFYPEDSQFWIWRRRAFELSGQSLRDSRAIDTGELTWVHPIFAEPQCFPPFALFMTHHFCSYGEFDLGFFAQLLAIAAPRHAPIHSVAKP